MNLYGLNYQELMSACTSEGLPPATAGHLFRWYYKKLNTTDCDEHNFSIQAKSWLRNKIDVSLPSIHQVFLSDDQTVKFQIRLKDNHLVETVLIPFHQKYTVCLSSQVGCAMACSFCFTGLQGYKRHLSTDEIIGQLIVVKKWLTDNRASNQRISNLVFMGQGEPLHNYDNVKRACQIFLDQRGLSFAHNKITVSTAGYLPGLLKVQSEFPNVNIALSFHSPQDSVRNELIPINQKYKLKDVLDTIKKIPISPKRFVTIEYLMIDSLTDSPEDAHLTAQLLEGVPAFVNLIPFNAFPDSPYKRASDERILMFQQILKEYGLPVTVRTTKGDEILAACGQLNLKGSSSLNHLTSNSTSSVS